MTFFKQLCLILIIFFSFFSLALEDKVLNDYLNTDTINCSNLLKARKKHSENMQLAQISLKKALASAIQFLDNIKQKKNQEIEKTTKELKKLLQTSDNIFNQLLTQEEKINHSFKSCKISIKL